MTFWVNVGLAYLLLLGAGLALGAYVGSRRRRGGRGGNGPQSEPFVPAGPSFALAVPPLGSAFDRALLPGAFADEPMVPLAG